MLSIFCSKATHGKYPGYPYIQYIAVNSKIKNIKLSNTFTLFSFKKFNFENNSQSGPRFRPSFIETDIE